MASTAGAAAPVFTTAPRIKLVMGTAPNDITIGFAIGMNINISVNQQPVQVIGEFGPVSIEPTMYNVVTGTMQIIRLASSLSYTKAKSYFTSNPGILGDDVLGTKADASPDGIDGSAPVETAVEATNSNSPAAQAGLIRHLDPRTVLLSRSFDIHLKLKVPTATDTDVQKLLNSNFTDDPSLTTLDGKLTEVSWMTIKGCRLTSRNVNISLGQMVNEPVSFQGLIATTYSGTTELMKLD